MNFPVPDSGVDGPGLDRCPEGKPADRALGESCSVCRLGLHVIMVFGNKCFSKQPKRRHENGRCTL